MVFIVGCRHVNARVPVEYLSAFFGVGGIPVKFMASITVCIVNSVQQRVHDDRETGVDVEQADDFLGFPGCVDVQTGYTALFDSVEGPFYDSGIDEFSRWKLVEGGPVGSFDHQSVASFGLRCFGGQCVDTVNVARVQNCARRCLNEELGAAQHVARV